MKKTQIVNGVTAKIEIEEGEKRNHLATYKNIEEMVSYMTGNDVIHKGANIGNDFYIINLEKTDQAQEDWYENEMRIKNKDFPQPGLPTDMYK